MDSRPTVVSPPSRINRFGKSSSTWLAWVGLVFPEGFALGAARSLPNFCRSVKARGWLGTRIARESSPALARRERGEETRRGKTRVKGPGQNVFARTSAFSFQRTCSSKQVRVGPWIIKGLKVGRFFSSKIFATANSFVASAATP